MVIKPRIRASANTLTTRRPRRVRRSPAGGAEQGPAAMGEPGRTGLGGATPGRAVLVRAVLGPAASGRAGLDPAAPGRAAAWPGRAGASAGRTRVPLEWPG